MINFIDGEIEFDRNNILLASDYEGLNTLAKKGLIDKRSYPQETYYYADHVADDMNFGVFISLRENKIDYIALRWLDGPCTSKGWDGVSEKALNSEYHRLLDFVETSVGRSYDSKSDRQRTWSFKWGKVDVSYESRDFVTQIYMRPR